MVLRRPAPLVAALVGAAAASGCGAEVSVSTGGDTVDRAKAEALVAQAARDEAGLRVKGATCPGDVKAEVGVAFTCTLTGRDGTTARVPGKVTSVEDGGRIRVGAPLIHMRDVERTMVQALREQVGSSAKVTCPEVVLGRKGGTFTCRATAAEGSRADLPVTMTNAKGGFRYKVVPRT